MSSEEEDVVSQIEDLLQPFAMDVRKRILDSVTERCLDTKYEELESRISGMGNINPGGSADDSMELYSTKAAEFTHSGKLVIRAQEYIEKMRKKVSDGE